MRSLGPLGVRGVIDWAGWERHGLWTLEGLCRVRTAKALVGWTWALVDWVLDGFRCAPWEHISKVMVFSPEPAMVTLWLLGSLL